MEKSVAFLALTLLMCLSLELVAPEDTTESLKKLRGNKKPRHRNNNRYDEPGACELEITCKGDFYSEAGADGMSKDEPAALTGPVRLPIRGPRGPPGQDGDPGMRGEDGLPGLPGLPGLSAPVPSKIAFFVGLSLNMGPVTDHTDVIFDKVVTNIGSAYNSNTGRFTAPVNGTFQFNVIVSAQGRQKAAVTLLKNGSLVATAWAESIPYWATASNIAILSLEKGDQVWLMLISRASYLHGYMYTTFSGFMIFEN